MGTSEYRKVFVCTSCGGVYADEPVTQCDCMPEKQDFREMLIVPRETLAAIQHESDCVDAAKERIANLEKQAGALESIFEWTGEEKIPADRKVSLIRNAARQAIRASQKGASK